MKYWFYILEFCFSIWISLGSICSYAHPLDVSNTSLSLYEKTIQGVTYIHPVEIDRILIQSGGVNPDSLNIDTYYSLTGVLVSYLSETIHIENLGKKCVMENFGFQEGLMIDEVFTRGFPISYEIHCDDKIRDPHIYITFCNDIPLQTNRLSIYTKNTTGEFERADYRILNTQKTSHIFLSENTENNTIKDTDDDGINDEDELVYGTRPDNPDTDGDGYTDGREIQNSWNPLDRELSPGQLPFTERTADEAKNIPKNDSLQNNNSSVWGGELFGVVLKKIRIYIEDSTEKNILPLMLIVGMLGFIHALGPGHSKGILVAQVLEKNMNLMKIFLYSTVFSIIHIIDIVVVVLLSRYLLQVIDPSQYLGTIQEISVVLILILGIYLLIRSIQQYTRKTQGKDNNGESKHHIFLAILTGITPCAFGWSIFLMLLSTGNMELALPLLMSLGIGIFLCLMLIGTISLIIRKRIYTFSPKIATLSPILSASFIICIGLGFSVLYF